MKKCLNLLNPWWTIPIHGGVGVTAVAVKGSAAVGFAYAGASFAAWSVGTSLGCAMACGMNACSYDY